MNCICGSPNYKTESRKGLVAAKEGRFVDCSIPVAVCDRCGLIRQINLPFETEDEYARYYSDNYAPGKEDYYGGKNYKGSLGEGKRKYERWSLRGAKRLLDVGCGSGYLVDYCRQNGIEAYGCELVKYHHAPENPHIYFRKFEDIHFPTDHFDHVICSDVIEHVLDPREFLGEAFRVTSIDGSLHIELPQFYGDKDSWSHWKRNEHIWYFTPKQFEKLLHEIGFIKVASSTKQGAKITFTAKKPQQNRVKFLLPPGIGDVYWPLVKIEALLEREGIKPPVDAYVAAPRAKKYQSEARAFPFLEMFPFLHSTGEVRFNHRDPTWQEAYLQQGRTIFKNVQGCDYFITWNGHVRAGKTMEEIDPDLKCNWFPSRFVSLAEEEYRKRSVAQYGNYLVMFWSFTGTNGRILKHFTLRELADSIAMISEQVGLLPILMGAIWDKDDSRLNEFMNMLPKTAIDLREETSIEEVFGLIRGSKAMIGISSGITIMAAVFGVKTIMLIHDYLFTGGVHRDFAWNTLPPIVRGKTYFAEYADKITWRGLATKMISIVKNDPRIESDRYQEKRRRHKASEIKETPVGHISIRDVIEPTRIVECNITIVCLLKSGGSYTADYVLRLRNMVKRNTSIPHRFTCLTDVDLNGICDIISIQDGSAGSWAKIEIFRPGIFDTRNVIYLDLDTVIIDNIDDIIGEEYVFMGLKPWNPGNLRRGMFASGMLAWKNGEYDFIHSNYMPSGNWPAGDQEYISEALKKRNKKFGFLQDKFGGIYSYKKQCKKDVPGDARIICFHGRPRPNEVKTDWMIKHWR